MRRDYQCDVVCKITARIENFDIDDIFMTFTGMTVAGVHRHVAKEYPGATLTFGEPIWVLK